MREARDMGGDKVLLIGAHPGARFFSLTPREILELEESGEGLDGIEADTTWGHRFRNFLSGTKQAYERFLKGNVKYPIL